MKFFCLLFLFIGFESTVNAQPLPPPPVSGPKARSAGETGGGVPPILKILEAEPKDLDEIEKLIRFHWHDKALEALSKYPPHDSRVLFLKGTALIGKGRYDEALSVLEKVSDKKFFKEAQVKKGVALSRWKRYSESLKLFEPLITQEKRSARRGRLRWLAFKTALEGKKYEEALEFLKPLKNIRSHWWRGWCYFRLGQFENALKNWDLIPPHRSFGYYPRVLFWKGYLYERQGLKAAANDFFQKLIEKHPETYYGFLARERLNLKSNLELFKEDYPLLYEVIIFKQAKQRSLDPYFVMGLIRQESKFKEMAVSSAGAMGLMQLTAQTVLKLVKVTGRRNFEWADLFDPETNVTLGCVYLKFLKGLFQNRPEQVIAAYNAGEEAVSRWLSLRKKESWIIFVEEIPYDQTQNYVQKVLTNYWIYKIIFSPKSP